MGEEENAAASAKAIAVDPGEGRILNLNRARPKEKKGRVKKSILRVADTVFTKSSRELLVFSLSCGTRRRKGTIS